MSKRESSPEPSSSLTPITGFETAIEYVKMKRRQPVEMTTPLERESLFLTEKVFNKHFIALFLSDPSPQALGYELELDTLRAKMNKMRPEIARLEALKNPQLQLRALGLRSKVNHVESLQEHVRLLKETCRKLKSEKIALEENVAVLGRMANLMWVMTMTMVRYSYQDSGISDEDEIELLMDNLEMLRDVASLMDEMSELMANVSAQE
jgi:hypothetical protein